jgi:hypothetical protein
LCKRFMYLITKRKFLCQYLVFVIQIKSLVNQTLVLPTVVIQTKFVVILVTELVVIQIKLVMSED